MMCAPRFRRLWSSRSLLSTLQERSVQKSILRTNLITGPKRETNILEALRYFATYRGYSRRKPISRPLQKNIVNSLQLGDRNTASHLLSELGSGNKKLRSENFILILEYCATTPDPLFAMEIWKLMMERNLYLDDKNYLFTIQALCKGGYLKEAFDIVSFIKENRDKNALLPVYNTWLKACIQSHSFNYTIDCLNLMEHQMSGKNEMTYGLLLKLAVLEQDLSAVKEIWKECNNRYPLGAVTLRMFAWSFSRLGDLDSAYAALQKMIGLAIRHDLSITEITEGTRMDIPIPYHGELMWDRQVNNGCVILPLVPDYYPEDDSSKIERAKAGIVAEQVRDGRKSFSGMHHRLAQLFICAFNDVIHACCSKQNDLLAEKLMLQMQKLGLYPSRRTYDCFIKAVVPVRGLLYGMNMLDVMQQKDIKPLDETLISLSVSCSRNLELDFAETLLDQISHCSSAYPYNAFLEACDNLDKPERALQVFGKMKRLNLVPDIRTYELLFSLFGNVNAPYEDGNILSQVDVAKRIKAIEIDMMRHGIQHSNLSMQKLLKALGTEGMIKDLMQYLHTAEYQLLQESTSVGTPLYNNVLVSLVKAKESGIAFEIFKSMVVSGFPRDEATYDIVINCCSTIKCYKSASALVSMMIRDGFCPDVVTYTALMKILMEFEDFGRALELLNQAASEGILPDIVLYNTFLKFSRTKGRIDLIELIVERMRREKIQPDPSTCSHVFSTYADHEFHSTAMEALQVLSLRMISLDDDVLEQIRTKYEFLIFHEDPETELVLFEIFEVSPNLATALLSLRWCVTSGFSISWLPNRSPWAMRLSGNHDSIGPG